MSTIKAEIAYILAKDKIFPTSQIRVVHVTHEHSSIGSITQSWTCVHSMPVDDRWFYSLHFKIKQP